MDSDPNNNPSQSEASSSPEPSTSEDAVPSRGEEEEEDYFEDETLHGEISNPPSPLGGRIGIVHGRYSGSELEVISSSTSVERRPPSSLQEEPLIDSTVDSSGMSTLSAPRPPLAEEDRSLPAGLNDAISTTTSSSGREEEYQVRKRCHPHFNEESNGISSSCNNDHPIPSTSSGLSNQDESLHIGQAFSGIPQSFLLMSPRHPPPPTSQNGNHGPVTSSHSSILESLSGPLSKRLRTLHNLQQRHQDEPSSSPPSQNEEPAQSSSQNVDSSGPSHSSSADDPSSSNNEDDPIPGTSSYGTQQTFSVTVEAPYPTASSLSHLTWNQGGLSKARASLPEDLLFLKSEEEGVFAKKEITQGYRFGPVEGKRVKPLARESDKILLLIHKSTPQKDDKFAGSRIVDVSNEDQSNWLRFVRQASTFSEQNLCLSQHEEELYFSSTKVISPDEELKVWYSEEYARVRKLPLLEPESPELENNSIDQNNKKDSESEGEESWPLLYRRRKGDICKTCNLKYAHPGIVDCGMQLITKNCIPIQTAKKTYECSVCGLHFNHGLISDLHALNHSSSGEKSIEGFASGSKWRDLICPLCHVGYNSFSELVHHSTIHGFKSDEKENIANNIPTRSPAAQNCEKHPENDINCHSCNKSLLNTTEHLQKRVISHKIEDSKPIVCSECGKIFLTTNGYICHYKIHSAAKRSYDCPICGEIFDQVIQIKEHVHVHRINNQYTCPHCSKVFSEYALIRKHIRAFHSEKKFSCPHCDKCFTGADKLKVHLVKHSDVREFSCNQCGKQFKRKDKLKEHAKRMHPRIDDVQKPNNSLKISSVDYNCFIYKCHKCKLGFKRRGMLVNHLANRHPDISLQSVPELNLPILKTTRDYFCQYCNKVYKSSSKRKSHILKNHPGLELPVSVRDQAAVLQISDNCGDDPTFSAMVGSVTSQPHKCEYCHKTICFQTKITSTSSKKNTQKSNHHPLLKRAELVEFRMDTGRVINFKSLEPPQQQPQQQPDTYHVSAAGVAFVPFMPKSEQPPNDKSGFVTINASALKTNHHLLVEGPSSLEPSHIEHLLLILRN
ncbi:PR domain zinc finger protein 10 [Lepeophtheirus salmonis]|uniref:PR domain zinc finger protein 10 n=1 Tax=Lepeophtheirus salmonis TaxID=72036 RepID=A0A7R8H0W0_LEPSM|nr:PR domain zinc finger protein 10 [Lepeophtheirus salmonis]CAF2796864.1 PR domain zinc finger protein 10 [Lepeophtheirus salmonis]